MTFVKYGKRVSDGCLFYRNSFMGCTTVPNKRINTRIAEKPVLFDSMGNVGVITYNRPNDLNYVDLATWKLLGPCLQAWEYGKTHVIMKGSGKAFCSGGNIRWLLNPEHDPDKYAFVKAVANGLYRLSKYRIPSISLIDGIALSGGLMIGACNRYRIATERTLVATPEASIGWLTAASATYFLPRLDYHLGFYMALTGKQLKGKDIVASGIATHYVPSARLQELESELCHCKPKDIEARLNAYSEPVNEFSLDTIIKDVDYCFSGGTVEEIIERLLYLNSPWSTEAVETLKRTCPSMLKVILRALHHGKANDFKQCLRMEYRVVYRCFGGYNAEEGMRASVIDKDYQPKWRPATLAEVTEAMVDSYFKPLPADEELAFYDDEPNYIVKDETF